MPLVDDTMDESTPWLIEELKRRFHSLDNGFILDEKGLKMSKSLGNTVSPQQVIKQYGADILRLWVAQCDYTVDMRIGPEILKGVADSYRKLRNTARFLLGNLSEYGESVIEYNELPDLEKYILSRVFEVDKKIRESYESYSFQHVFQIYFQFYDPFDDYCSSSLLALIGSGSGSLLRLLNTFQSTNGVLQKTPPTAPNILMIPT